MYNNQIYYKLVLTSIKTDNNQLATIFTIHKIRKNLNDIHVIQRTVRSIIIYHNSSIKTFDIINDGILSDNLFTSLSDLLMYVKNNLRLPLEHFATIQQGCLGLL